MKVVLAGGCGHLGSDILKSLVAHGHQVICADMVEREIEGLTAGKDYEFRKLDVTDKEALKGVCDGAEIVLTTVGLVSASKTVTNYDIDYQGNLNLLEEAKAAGVKKFVYVSVLKADSPRAKKMGIDMLLAKRQFEEALIASGMDYLIVRPTGYFYDIAHVYMPMIEKGEVTVLDKNVKANVIDTTDLGDWIAQHMEDKENKITSVGGTEVYTYEEIAKMFFDAAGKPCVIKEAPVFVFRMLYFINKIKKTGRAAVIKFGEWTMVESMVAEDVHYGKKSFKDYVYSLYK